MNNLFGIFDPIRSSIIELNWINLIVIILLPSSYWIVSNRLLSALSLITKSLHKEIRISLGNINTPGVTWFSVSLFLLIATINYIGLMPYIFTSTRHLRFTLSLAIMVWTSLILGSLTLSLYEFLVHLVPVGTPLGLIILIVLIELVRVLIRPITLSVRLAANIVAGHLLISLVCIPSLSRIPIMFICLTGARIIIVLERAVALIQAYVFSTLSSLYISDLNSTIKLLKDRLKSSQRAHNS